MTKMDDSLTREQIEAWRKKICDKIFYDFSDDHQTEYRKSLSREFNILCNLALRQDSSGGVLEEAADKLVEMNDQHASAIAKKLRTLATPQESRSGVLEFDMEAHLSRQREWSERTFGPGARTAGVLDHIRKELKEIEDAPADIREWIDVVILALDGAWRAGYTPTQIIEAIQAKQTKNENRQWPDWRTSPPDKAIEHDKPRTDETEGK